MKPLMQHILLAVCLLCAHITHAQVREGAAFSLSQVSDSLFWVDFRLGDIALRPASDSLVAIEADGMAILAPRAGLPALPQASRLLALPRGSRIAIGRTETSQPRQLAPTDGNSRRLLPYAGASVKDREPQMPAPDKDTYGNNSWYSAGAPVEVEDLGVMADHQLYRITVHPVRCLPSTATLELTDTITATLTVHPTATLLRSTATRDKYLIVSRPEFRDGLQDFVRWKRQQGFAVAEIYATTHLRDSVRALVATHFSPDSAEWPRYMLLVGDAAQLQSFIGTVHPSGTESHTTDLYYAEHTGDYLPDALLGRWPVNDTAELRAVAEKTLRYEQCRNLDTGWLSRVLLVAGEEDEPPAPQSTNGQVNYLAREIKLAHPALDTLTYRNPASGSQRSAILHDLGQGATLLNYTAHCTTGGWTSPAVSFTNIDTLQLSQPLLFVNNCCQSNSFGGTCFGEQLLRAPDGGAIGVIGATNSTLWEEDYYWAVGPKLPIGLQPDYIAERPGAFDRWIGRTGDVATQGGLLVAGNLAVSAFGSPNDRFYWEIYCLLGDPSLEPWVGAPQSLDCHIADGNPRNGATSLHLTGTPGATVTAMQHDTVLGIARIGEQGTAAMELNRSLDTLPLVLTATASDHRPRIDTLSVDMVDGLGVALRDIAVTDSNVSFRLENIGTLPLHHLQYALVQPDAAADSCALILEQTASVDTLEPHQSVRVSLPVHITAVGQLPFWRARLLARDSSGTTLCSLGLRRTMSVRYPKASFRLLDAAGTLCPDRSYRLQTTIDGDMDSASLLLTAYPAGDTLLLEPLSDSVSTLPFSTPDTLTHLHVETTLRLGNHVNHQQYWLVAGHRMDSFEEGLGSHPWQSGGSAPWQLDSSMVHEGHFSLRSGAIGPLQTSDLTIELLLPQSDTLVYWARTSSEERHDRLQIYIDGERRSNEMSGESQWRRHRVMLSEGRHTVTWRYVKDGSDDAGSDCAWLDDIRMPLALWYTACGWFGVPDALGIVPTDSLDRLDLYPNPTSGRVILRASQPGMLTVTDLMGRTVYSTQVAACDILDLSHLPDGIYLMQMLSPSGAANQKIIIRHQP